MKINIYTYEESYNDGRIFDRLDYLRLLIHLDISKRILAASNLECDICVVILLENDKNKSSSLEFPPQIAEEYNFLSAPHVSEVYQGHGTNWPTADIVFIPRIWGKLPYTENPPEWITSKTINTINSFSIAKNF